MKKQIPWLVLCATILVVFNVCFFVIIANAPKVAPSIWVSYTFIHLAYALLLCTPVLVRRGNAAMADYRRPMYVGTWVHFVLSLAVNVAFIMVSLNSALVDMYQQAVAEAQSSFVGWLVKLLVDSDVIAAGWLLTLLGTPISVAAAVVVNIIMLGAAVVYLSINAAANNDTARQQERHEQELQYVKTASSRLKYLVDHAPATPAMRSVEQLYDDVMCSPLRSNSKANAIERQLLAKISDLENAVNTNNEAEALALCAQMKEMANRRNRIVNESN